MRALICALSLLGACAGEPATTPAPSVTVDGADGADGADGSDGSDGASDGLVGAHDGSYTLTMHRAGGHFALGTAEIERNVLEVEVLSNAGLSVTVRGEVARDGAITVTDVVASDGSEVEIPEARVSRGVIEAVYTVEGEEGTLVGTKDGALLVQTPVRTFDGSYELALVRDDEEVANSVLDIRRGAFQTSISTAETLYDLEGFVTSDGVLVVNEVSGGDVVAEATIDQDSLDIEGIYRADGRVGLVIGRRSD